MKRGSASVGGGGGASASSATEVIARTVLSSTAATIAFSTIPDTYESLEVVISGRSDRASGDDAVSVQFNGDTGTNYFDASINQDHTTVSSTGQVAAAFAYAGRIPAASATASRAGSIRILIPGYARTTFHKSTIAHGGFSTGTAVGDQQQLLACGLWANTAAITTVTLVPGVGPFSIGTVATLYGIKGA